MCAVRSALKSAFASINSFGHQNHSRGDPLWEPEFIRFMGLF